jgi:hypothetical protein
LHQHTEFGFGFAYHLWIVGGFFIKPSLKLGDGDNEISGGGR